MDSEISVATIATGMLRIKVNAAGGTLGSSPPNRCAAHALVDSGQSVLATMMTPSTHGATAANGTSETNSGVVITTGKASLLIMPAVLARMNMRKTFL